MPLPLLSFAAGTVRAGAGAVVAGAASLFVAGAGAALTDAAGVGATSLTGATRAGAAASWRAWEEEDMFFRFSLGYVFTITYESTLKLEFYQMVWWELSSTVELLHGGAPALKLCFQS